MGGLGVYQYVWYDIGEGLTRTLAVLLPNARGQGIWLEKNHMCRSALCLQQLKDCESFWVPLSHLTIGEGVVHTHPATPGMCSRDLTVAASTLPGFG